MRPAHVPRAWIVLALLYAGWAIGRAWSTPALEFDEAEQALHQQWWLAGYGPQPPLFEWVLWGLRQTTGMSALAALWLLKAVALWGVGVAVAWFVAQQGTRTAAGAVAAWTLTLPLLLWDAPRTLTHSLLATVCVAAVVGLSAPLLHRPAQPLSRWRWFGLGLFVGAALLSKYNTVLALAGWLAVLLAALVHGLPAGAARWQAVQQHARGLPWAVVGMAPVGVHAAWLIDAWPEIQATLGAKMQGEGGHWGQGFVALAVAWLANLALPLALLGAAGWLGSAGRVAPTDASDAAGRPVRPWLRWALLYAAVVAGAMAALVLVGALHQVKERWVLPLTPPLLALTVMAAAQSRIDWVRLQRWSVALIAMALCLLVIRPWVLAWLDRPANSRWPVRDATAWLGDLLPPNATVVADPIQLAGALAAYGPEGWTVVYPHSAIAVLRQVQACTVWSVTAHHPPAAAPLPHVWAPVAAPKTVTLPMRPAGRTPALVTLYAQPWQRTDAACPAAGTVYDRTP